MPDKFIGADILLIAALDIHLENCQKTFEFTEFQLTVQAWFRDRMRFGMRGYEHLYPDHKRAYSELISTKPGSPIYKGYMRKTRPNAYKLTPEGVKVATALRERFIESQKGMSCVEANQT